MKLLDDSDKKMPVTASQVSEQLKQALDATDVVREIGR